MHMLAAAGGTTAAAAAAGVGASLLSPAAAPAAQSTIQQLVPVSMAAATLIGAPQTAGAAPTARQLFIINPGNLQPPFVFQNQVGGGGRFGGGGGLFVL